MTSTINPTACRLAVLVALCTTLVTTSVAYADATPPPDRVDRIGVAPPVAPVQLSPDRADGLGSARLPYVPVPTVIVRTAGSDGFDWADAAVGAASALAVSLLAGAGIMARGRRQVALPS